MSDNDKPASDQLPDRLSVDPRSPYYNEQVLSREVGIRFKAANFLPTTARWR